MNKRFLILLSLLLLGGGVAWLIRWNNQREVYLPAVTDKDRIRATARLNITSPSIKTPLPSRHFQLVATNLQAELNGLRKITFEHNPAKRPVISSERAANRRDWALRALEYGYAQGGGTNKLWDSQMHAAFAAYADYSRAGTTDRQYAALTNAVLAAVATGCRDPMLRYLQVRYEVGTTNHWQELAIDRLHAFLAMFGSKHHPVFIFRTGYFAVLAARDTDGMCDLSGALDLVTAALEDLARDTNAPPEEVFEAASSLMEVVPAIRGWPTRIVTNLQPIMESNWGRQDAYFRWLGVGEIGWAWDDRGEDAADKVTEAGWEGFRRHLGKAEAALATAWQMNPSNAYTAYLMMKVELGQGQGRDRMELWFNRTMTLATNNHDAVAMMALYLEPRWFGSEEEDLKFARSCVASTNWGGQVPLVLPNVHHRLAYLQGHMDSPEYWQRPEVWDDVRTAYTKFFALNPKAWYFHHNYARDAYLCGHYDVFLAQCRLLPQTNFYLFGGEARFRLMLDDASTPPPSGVPK